MASIFRSPAAVTAGPQPVVKSIPSEAASAIVQSLQAARKAVQEQLTKDVTRMPELGDFIASVSASKEYVALQNDCWTPFYVGRQIPLHDEVFANYSGENMSLDMGLFPEIHRVWVAEGTRVSLWNYVDGREVYTFPPHPSTVVHVALMKPKPGVFVDSITHLIIVVSHTTITLYGLAYGASQGTVTPASQTPSDAIGLFDTDMVIPTPETEMRCIVGNDQGRIFLCGRSDGCIYELTYQREEGFFQKRCGLINHTGGGFNAIWPSFLSNTTPEPITDLVLDSKRQCLYSLTAKNAIQIFFLGHPTTTTPSTAFSLITSHKDILQSATYLCPSSPLLNPATFSIRKLYVTLPEESKTIHLVAVTTKGVRLYFTHHKRMGNYLSPGLPATSPPNSLDLLHVRLPPMVPVSAALPNQQSYTTHQQQQQAAAPLQLENIIEATGTAQFFFATQPLPPSLTRVERENDIILACAADLPRLGSFAPAPTPQAAVVFPTAPAARPPFTESVAPIRVGSSVYAVAAESPSTFQLSNPGASTLTSELVTMFTQPPPSFLALSTEGVTVIVRRRAVDVLRALVDRSLRTNNETLVREFVDQWGRDQVCAMLWAILCGNSFMADSPAVFPSMGDGTFGIPLTHGFSLNSAGLTQATMKSLVEYGGRPAKTGWSGNPQDLQIIYSGRHDGLAIYISRLLRPIWKEKIMILLPAGWTSNIKPAVLLQVQHELASVKVFIDQTPGLFSAASGLSPPRGAVDPDAFQTEVNSCKGLHQLAAQTIEAIAFIMLLIDHKLSEVVKQCEASIVPKLHTITYEDLLVTEDGRHVARNLVNAVINLQIAQQTSVDAVSDVLQQRCGSFCSPDDVILYKAIENIRTARALRPEERLRYLKESLKLFHKGIRTIPTDKLPIYCQDYCELRFPHGAVELPLRCAREWDPFDLGSTWYLEGLSPTDPAGANAWARRKIAYTCVVDALTTFDTMMGQPHDSTDNIDSLRNMAYQLALNSDDEAFHSYLYTWFMDKGDSSRLLELRTPYVELFLQSPPMSSEKCQLLWQFYVRNDRSYDAAMVLYNMAFNDQFNMDLDERIQLLSRAIGNAKAISAPVDGSGEFLTDLEERLEVAQLQAEIYGIVEERFASKPQERDAILKSLAGRLWTITELYQKCAVPYDLDYAKLLILHVSDHHDLNLVMSSWRNIIEEARDKARSEDTDIGSAVGSTVSFYGRRLYPSDAAFPIQMLFNELLAFQYTHKDYIDSGWTARTLSAAKVPYEILLETLEVVLRDQSVPPWNTPNGGNYLRMEIATLLQDWWNVDANPLGARMGNYFPAEYFEAKVNEYLSLQTTEEGRTKLTQLSRAARRTY